MSCLALLRRARATVELCLRDPVEIESLGVTTVRPIMRATACRLAARIGMRVLPVLFLAACFPMVAAPPTAVAPGGASQREAFARSAGYPTRHTAADLQALIDQQLVNYAPVGRTGDGSLQAPGAFTFDGERHTCYQVVMHLADGAAWGQGAEAGLKFSFAGATGNGMGGPGVRGPGAVVAVGCSEAPGAVTLTMAPLFGADPIGSGPYKLEVFGKKLSEQAWADKRVAEKAEEDRMAREQAEDHAREQAKVDAGCNRCDGRYQGCIGAGRDHASCQSEFTTCEFEQVGGGATCPRPN
jgi:hypothetical protein